MLAFPAIKSDTLDAQVVRPGLLSLPERTLFPQHDQVVDVPIPLTLAKTMKSNHIVSIHVESKAVRSVCMERAESTVPVLSGWLEKDSQMGLGIIDDRIEVRCGLDFVVGGHSGIIGKCGWDCQD